MLVTEWAIEIKRVDNGYLIRRPNEMGDGIEESVIQEKGDNDLSSGEELLWEVIEYLALGGSKHDEERIAICREYQDHVECRGVKYRLVEDE